MSEARKEELFQQGLASFKQKNFEKAEQLFSQGIALEEKNAKLYANRSAARLRLKQIRPAIDDARICIKLKPQWSKGYFRLALALNEMQEKGKAYKAICLAYAMEPSAQLYRDMKNGLRMEIMETAGDQVLVELEQEIGHLLPRNTSVVVTSGGLEASKTIPVTVLSGFLGSGKTTLMTHILTTWTEKKVAIIVNDMSSVNIDATILRENDVHVTMASEELVELSNGCICCTLREDLLHEILRIANTGKYDHILVESTGISEPVPVAQTFLLEDLEGNSLAKVAHLDSMITVVDANAFPDNLGSLESLRDRQWQASDTDERSIANLLVDQVEFANIIVINKKDLAQKPENGGITRYEKTVGIISSLNPSAEILETNYCKVDLTRILGRNLFDMNKASNFPGWLLELRGQHIPETEEYGIRSFVYKTTQPFHLERLQALVADNDFLYKDCNVVRAKGTAWIAQDPRLMIEWSCAGFQVECRAKGFWSENDERLTQIVFIGIKLEKEKLIERLDSCCCPLDEFTTNHCDDTLASLPIVQDVYAGFQHYNLVHESNLSSQQCSQVMQFASETHSIREKRARIATIRAELTNLQDKPGELTPEELCRIQSLATEYTELLQSFQVGTDETETHLQHLKHEISQLNQM